MLMERRDFVKNSVMLGSGLLAFGLAKANPEPLNGNTLKIAQLNDAKKIFRQKGTCSNTFCYLINREFGNNDENYERATDLLAGGLAQSGHQCGMLWGSSLAVGTEAYLRCGSCNDAIGTSIVATQHIMNSFALQTDTANCREVIGFDFKSRWDTMCYMAKVIVGGMDNNVCFILAEKWAPEAVQAAMDGLVLRSISTKTPVSCASEVVRKMGGSERELVMASGYAGGLGLSGNACGALAAAIWMNMFRWQRKNPDKLPKYFNNPVAKRILKSFYAETNKEIVCQKICNRSFYTVDEHSVFIKNGGCDKLINILANA
jgi:hypothetical protein